MITGHFGVAGIARSVTRTKMNSGLFIAVALASLTPDILDGLYFALGICSPFGLYSHTLHAIVLEAAVVGGAALLITGSRVTALSFAVIIFLHIPADLITGHKLLLPGGEMIGLFWYEKPLFDFVLEVPTVILGWWVLRRRGLAPQWAASVWALTLVLLVQTTFDVLSTGSSRGVKPSACYSDAGSTVVMHGLVGLR
ncbi:MAG: hypothetical protein ABI969_07305 [bacterium]